MIKIFAQESIIPRGFNGAAPDLSTTDTSVIKEFYKKTQPNISGNKFESVQDLMVTYTQIALSLAGYALMFALIYSGVKYMLAGDDESKLTSAKKNLYWSIIGFAIVFFSLAIFNLVISEELGGKLANFSGNINIDIVVLITSIISWGLGIIGLLFMLLLVVNGFKYLISAGSEGTESAKKGIFNAIIGIVIVAFSFAIAVLIQTTIAPIPVK